MNLAVLARGAAEFTSEQREVLAECETLAQRATNELRTTAYLLHPPALDSLGLVRAVEDYARGFAARSGMQVQLELPAPDDLGRLSQEVELSLFRIVQESLGNAWRHAGGKSVAIRIGRGDGHIELDVSDDGCGPPVLSRNAAGVGIAGMRERLRLLGGQLEIEAAVPGTRVRARLPVEEIAP
jgi:signal transduction histidine kinase